VLSRSGLTWLAYAAALGGAAYTIWSRRQTLEARQDTDDDAA
jgi:hypothetical protein